MTASALDIRALDSDDKPFIGIPYDSVPLLDTIVALADQATSAVDFDHTNWGSGLAWITYAIILRIGTNVEFNTKDTQGFRVDLLNRTVDYAMRQYFPAKFYPSIEEITDEWWVYKTIFYPGGFYSTAAQVLRVAFRNETGQAQTINIHVVGVTV